LAREVGERLERGACALVHLRSRLGGKPRALLDQGQRRFGVELSGSKPPGSVLEPLTELNQGIGHAIKVTAAPVGGYAAASSAALTSSSARAF
jgi:hypothetical protein